MSSLTLRRHISVRERSFSVPELERSRIQNLSTPDLKMPLEKSGLMERLRRFDVHGELVRRLISYIINLFLDVCLMILYVAEVSNVHTAFKNLTSDSQSKNANFDINSLFSSNWFVIPRHPYIWWFLLFFSLCSLISFSIRILFWIGISVYDVLDLMLSLPVVVLAFLKKGYSDAYIPYFLRALSIIPRLRSIIRAPLQRSLRVEPRDLLIERLAVLLATLIIIVYLSFCSFQLAEFLYKKAPISAIDSFYFIVVTLSTVGYGDISASSEFSRVIVIMTILISFIMLPALIGSTLNTWKASRGYTTSFTNFGAPHVVVIGEFSSSSIVADILLAFVKNERISHRKVVFLSQAEASKAVLTTLNIPLFRDRARFIDGSALSTTDLGRASISKADAVFIYSNRHHRDDDHRNVLRLWSVSEANTEIKTYIATHTPEMAMFHFNSVTRVFCPTELNISLMGFNCIIKGVSTLITNLITTVPTSHVYSKKWQQQYADGALQEILCVDCSITFVGAKFKTITTIFYEKLGALLIGVQCDIPGTSKKHVMLNPTDYIFKGGEVLIIISHDDDIVAKLKNIDLIFFESKAQTFSQVKIHSVLKMQTPILDSFENCFVRDAKNMNHHIIVFTSDWNVFRFLKAVKGDHVPIELIRPVLFVSKSYPSKKEFEAICKFPEIYFMIGNPHDEECLTMAGISRAARVVLLPDQCKKDQMEDFADLHTILARHKIQETNSTVYTVIGLQQRQAIKFLGPTGGTYYQVKSATRSIFLQTFFPSFRAAVTDDIFYHPVYCSGEAFVLGMVDSALVHDYFKPVVLQVIRKLVGLQTDKDDLYNKVTNTLPCYLQAVDVPESHHGQTYKSLFIQMVTIKNVIPIAVYRAPSVELGNERSFVYTNPYPEIILNSKDVLYVLSSLN